MSLNFAYKMMLSMGAFLVGMSSAVAETKEVSVFGLNCGPCGEQLRKQMQDTAGATDLEAKLECGKIFVEMPDEASLNEGGLRMILLSKGFTLKGVKSSSLSVEQVRNLGDDVCKS